MKKSNIICRAKQNYNFEEVDIFLRVEGRLPTEKGDGLTRDILNKYCQRYESGNLVEGLIDLRFMYLLIISGKIKPIN